MIYEIQIEMPDKSIKSLFVECDYIEKIGPCCFAANDQSITVELPFDIIYVIDEYGNKSDYRLRDQFLDSGIF